MRIKFPNPFGYPIPNAETVEAFCRRFPVSKDYREFLEVQNGLDMETFSESEESLNYVEPHAEPENCPDLRALYGLDSKNPYYDLEVAITDVGTFGDLLLPIGSSYGGDAYVLVLAGKFKGYVASLDHEMHGGCDTVEEFAEEFEIEGFADLSAAEKADALLDEELGLAWLHAPSMSAFLASCIHCDSGRSGYVLDHPSITDEEA